MDNYEELAASLNAKLAHLDKQLARLDEQRNETLRDLEAIERVNRMTIPQRQPNQPRRGRPRKPIATDLVYGDIVPQDLVGCGTQEKAAMIMAQANDGMLIIGDAGRMIMAAGITKSKKLKSITSTLHRTLKESADWEHAGPGLFKYVGAATSAEAERIAA